jgi:hypothetical protein
MPGFQPSNDLPPNPSVRVFFVGLLILQPSRDGRRCEVFVNRSAPEHYLTVEVRQKRAGKPDIIKMRHAGPLSFLNVPQGSPHRHGLTILGNGANGVRAYNGANPSSEGQSVGSVIEMKARHAPVPVGDVDLLGGLPSLLMDDALFYSADKTPDDLIVTLKKRKVGSQPQPISPFSSIVGANVYLAAGGKVTVSYKLYGRDVNVELKQAEGPFEIYVSNDPLYEDDSLDVPKHDEFAEYYKILPGVPTDEQFIMEFPKPQGAGDNRGTTRTPCTSVLLDQ